MLTFVKQQDCLISSIYLANGLLIFDHIPVYLAIAGYVGRIELSSTLVTQSLGYTIFINFCNFYE